MTEFADSKIIVFVTYRDSVQMLVDYLNDAGITARRFVGQASRDSEKGLSQKQQIEAGLAALPPDYRQILLLREMHQRSYQEIAEILSLDLGTVKSRINRGRKQLRKFLLESGNFSPDAPSNQAEKEGCK